MVGLRFQLRVGAKLVLTGAIALIALAPLSSIAQTSEGKIPGGQSTEGNQAELEAIAGPLTAAFSLPVESLADPKIASSFSAISVDPASGIAMGGYDPVGYFVQQAATPGRPEYQSEYRGAKFYFASAENRDAFSASPERFAPAYGGYCTHTLASGALTQADPLNWTVHGDRLFLTKTPKATKEFREKLAYSVEAADAYWSQAGLDDERYNIRAHRTR